MPILCVCGRFKRLIRPMPLSWPLGSLTSACARGFNGKSALSHPAIGRQFVKGSVGVWLESASEEAVTLQPDYSFGLGGKAPVVRAVLGSAELP